MAIKRRVFIKQTGMIAAGLLTTQWQSATLFAQIKYRFLYSTFLEERAKHGKTLYLHRQNLAACNNYRLAQFNLNGSSTLFKFRGIN